MFKVHKKHPETPNGLQIYNTNVGGIVCVCVWSSFTTVQLYNVCCWTEEEEEEEEDADSQTSRPSVESTRQTDYPAQFGWLIGVC